MMGESPTRPNRFMLVPPVDVPAARLPALSSATAPTVPNFRSSAGTRPDFPLSARAFSGKYRSLAGVEERRILHHSDRGFDGVETGSSPRENLVARAQRDRQGVDVGLLHLRRHVLPQNRAGATVDHHREIGCGCCY